MLALSVLALHISIAHEYQIPERDSTVFSYGGGGDVSGCNKPDN